MSGRRQDIPKPVPEVMTIDDLAGYLQVSKSSLYKLAQEGRVPGQKVGRHWRFHKDSIDRWLDQQARPPGERGASRGSA
jgi:excisionase family DNA binding protein